MSDSASLQKFSCPFCQSPLEAGKEALHRRIQCWSCEEKFELSPEIFSPVAPTIASEAPTSSDELQSSLLEDTPTQAFTETNARTKRSRKSKKGQVLKSSRAKKTRSKKASQNKISKGLIFGVMLISLASFAGFTLMKTSSSEQVDNVTLEEAHSQYIPTGKEMTILNNNCIQCHGAIEVGKRIVKGSFDLVPLLQKGVQDDNTQSWLNVIDQIESGEMPPEQEPPLNEADKQAVVGFISHRLDKEALPQRLMTSFEILNTLSSVLGFDSRSYDPFERLHFIKNIDARFPTINSAALMSSDYLAELEAGLDMAIDRHVIPHTLKKQYLQYKDFDIIFEENISDDIGLTYRDTDKATKGMTAGKEKK